LVKDAESFESILNQYKEDFDSESLKMMRFKLGLEKEDENDTLLIQDLEDILQLTETDMTIFFRNLGQFKKENPLEGLNIVNDAFYNSTEVSDIVRQKWNEWFVRYASRLENETVSNSERKEKMKRVNPKYVLRNYMAQLAIDEADKGNYNLIQELYELLKQPYAEQPEHQKWFAKRPEWARHKVGCSMLSCSS
jgi:uncharacterized protein YdiU (UPF0061 family)